MRFASLGSGSRGNATLVEQGDTLLLIDCGFSLRETERRLLRLGRDPAQVSAILVTHEHGDHLSGVALFARRYGVPVWLSAGTRAAGNEEIADCRVFSSHASFAVGDVEVTPFPVPHDAREPTQFVFGNGAQRLGLLTDTGSLTPHIEQQLTGCDALVLECNHDPTMLANGIYPPLLKARVGGDYGHLSNEQAGTLLQRIDCSHLQHIVAAHLSDKNNTPPLAVAALATALDCEHAWIGVAHQDDGLGWRELA
ncbi:MBL fold metallo-hydrolase [Sulfurivermis fontis]|jgi:phosphoribosyl 1,2-cyclic phosphodiesterase|uniref:MBL fold metallo-hydrolase n=1 Tax=Sulfurivermis fontis TaxID=1972068 RepID=UPI000FDCC24B|nr:MBL fold metallo-hydrolase [Sulfurivermis fontis]